jgi:hypothetical protein
MKLLETRRLVDPQLCVVSLTMLGILTFPILSLEPEPGEFH